LADGTADGKVDLAALGQYLKRTNPSFTPNLYGHSGLLSMIRTYDMLSTEQETTGHWSVHLASKPGSEAETAVI